MHECESIFARLSLHLDDLLSADEQAALQADLERCPQCRVIYQAMSQADRALRREPMAPLSHDLTPAVMARIDRQQVREKRLLGLTLLVGSAMSLWPTLVAAFGLIFMILTSLNPGLLSNSIEFIVGILSGFQAVFLTLSAFGNVLSPWIFPSVAALFSMVLLVLTILWATRTSLRPRYLKA